MLLCAVFLCCSAAALHTMRRKSTDKSLIKAIKHAMLKTQWSLKLQPYQLALQVHLFISQAFMCTEVQSV